MEDNLLHDEMSGIFIQGLVSSTVLRLLIFMNPPILSYIRKVGQIRQCNVFSNKYASMPKDTAYLLNMKTSYALAQFCFDLYTTWDMVCVNTTICCDTKGKH